MSRTRKDVPYRVLAERRGKPIEPCGPDCGIPQTYVRRIKALPLSLMGWLRNGVDQVQGRFVVAYRLRDGGDFCLDLLPPASGDSVSFEDEVPQRGPGQGQSCTDGVSQREAFGLTLIEGVTEATSLGSSGYSTWALVPGGSVAWGNNKFGQVDPGDPAATLSPTSAD